MVFKSGCLVHVGTIKYKVVLNVWAVYFLRLRAGEEGEGDSRPEWGALGSVANGCLALPITPTQSCTHRNTPHLTALPAIWWPTSELHLCLPQGSYSISSKPQRQQITYMHRWLLESTQTHTIKCCCYKLKALLRQVRQTGNKKHHTSNVYSLSLSQSSDSHLLAVCWQGNTGCSGRMNKSVWRYYTEACWRFE